MSPLNAPIALLFAITMLVTTSMAKEPMSAAGAFEPVTFDDLGGFSFKIPRKFVRTRAERQEVLDTMYTQLPKTVRNLNGQAVAIEGYMFPIELKNGKVIAFLLVRDQSACCYGKFPELNQMVYVRLQDKPIDWLKDIPIIVSGTFEVARKPSKAAGAIIYRMTTKQVERSSSKPTLPW